jgi:predicted flap endonuclease-1-like 5' DNA nuclease
VEIDGIGPKGVRTLREAGIVTFGQLANASTESLRRLLPRQRIDLIRAEARRRSAAAA